MTKFNDPLKNVRVASPCSADWEQMFGDERKRFCGDCKLNVYNLSSMTREEAERFVTSAEGRVCVRYFARPDGTIITQDCPVGWAKFKQRTRLMAAALASVLATFIAGLFAVSIFTKRSEATVGTLYVPYATPTPKPRTKPTPDGQVIMGDISPAPTPTPKEIKPLMGQMVAPKDRN